MVEAELADELNNDADDSKPDLDTLKVSDVKNELSVQENDVLWKLLKLFTNVYYKLVHF